MASVQDVQGVNDTLIETGGLASQIAAGLVGGRVKVASDYYTILGTESAGSTISFLDGGLPAGAKIIAILLSAAAAQSSLTFALGNDYDADAYLAAGQTGLQTAVTPVVVVGKMNVIGENAGDDNILITTAAATATAGALYCVVLYTTD